MPFPEPQLPDTTPQRWAETTAEFPMRSTMGPAVEARARIRSWLSLVRSEAERMRLESDLTATNERRHRAAAWELGLLNALDAVGHLAVPHPPIDGMATTPDWLAVDRFYLEATLATDSDERTGEDRRVHELIDALEGIDSPDFLFGITVDQIGTSAPSKRKLKRFIERELGRLTHDFEGLSAAEGADERPTAVWRDPTGWVVEIEFIAVKSEARGNHGRNLATFSTGIEKSVASIEKHKVDPSVRQVSIEQKIRSALKQKIGKYGKPSLPLVVAVNVTPWMGGEHDVRNALFGTEQYVFRADGGRLRRLPDGVLRPGQNQRLSAVVVAHQQSIFSPGTARLWLNPWATRPFDPSLLPIDRVEVDLESGRLCELEGDRRWSELVR